MIVLHRSGPRCSVVVVLSYAQDAGRSACLRPTDQPAPAKSRRPRPFGSAPPLKPALPRPVVVPGRPVSVCRSEVVWASRNKERCREGQRRGQKRRSEAGGETGGPARAGSEGDSSPNRSSRLMWRGR